VGIEQWRRHYNEVRPHSSLGYLTPREFKASGATRAAAIQICRLWSQSYVATANLVTEKCLLYKPQSAPKKESKNVSQPY